MIFPMTQVIVLISYFIIFIIIMSIIAVYLLYQITQVEKVAQLFLLSLFIYFLFMNLSNVVQVVDYAILYNQGTTIIPPNTRMMNSIPSFMCSGIAPILLIHQVEKKFFPNIQVFSKYHLLMVINILTAIVFIVMIVLQVPTNIMVILLYPVWGINVIFISITFLILALRSTGKYMQFAFLISIGWAINNLSNVFHGLFGASVLNDFTFGLIFLGKCIGTIMAAYGFYKIYSLKKV